MKNTKDILTSFSGNVSRFLDSSQYCMDEGTTIYAIKDGYSVDEIITKNNTEYGKIDISHRGEQKVASDRRIIAANIFAPYINAQSGVLTKNKTSFAAYSTDPEFAGDEDVGSDVIKWCVEQSKYNHALNNVALDVLVRGIGGAFFSLDYTKNKIYGVPTVESKHHLFYDTSPGQALGSHNAAWCGYADPVFSDELERYIESEGGFKDESFVIGSGLFDAQLLRHVSNSRDDVGFRYHYCWHEYVDMRIVDNPLILNADILSALAEVHPELLGILGKFAKEQQLDLERSSKWRLDPDGWKAYQAMADDVDYMTGIPLPKPDVVKRKAKCYYHAEIIHGRVLNKSPSFASSCHPLNLAVGFYDRRAGGFYGTGRAMSNVQLAINDALSDLATYTSRASTGGTVGIKGMGTEMANTIDSIRNNERSFPLPADGAIQQLGTADASSSMLSLVQTMIELLPITGGTGKEILGMMNNDTPSALLFNAARGQMEVSLAPIANGLDLFISNSGSLFQDMTFELASLPKDGSEIILESISPGKDKTAYISLGRHNISRSYSVVVVEQATSEDAMHDEFIKFSEFLPLVPEQQRVAMLPALVKLSRADESVKDEMIKALTPQIDPAAAQKKQQQDDSMQDAQVRMINAQAAKLEQDANVSGQQAPVQLEETQSVIERNIASARASEAKAAQTLAQI